MAAVKARPKADVLRDIEDLGLGSLEQVFDVLKAAALGLKVLVSVEQQPPKGARKLGHAYKPRPSQRGSLPRCPHCNGVWADPPPGVYEVYEMLPDTGIARYLHEHLAGKAKVREEKQIDPTINVIFAADLTGKPELDEIEEEAAREGVTVDWSKDG